MQSYHQIRRDKPLTEEEVKERYEEVKDEMKEVLEWKKEEEKKFKEDKFKNPQAKSANKRALKRVERRVDSVNGMIDYWKNRKEGMSHFRASIELNEYWAILKEKGKEKEEKELAPKGVPRIVERGKKEAKAKLPRLLKNKKK